MCWSCALGFWWRVFDSEGDVCFGSFLYRCCASLLLVRVNMFRGMCWLIGRVEIVVGVRMPEACVRELVWYRLVLGR